LQGQNEQLQKQYNEEIAKSGGAPTKESGALHERISDNKSKIEKNTERITQIGATAKQINEAAQKQVVDESKLDDSTDFYKGLQGIRTSLNSLEALEFGLQVINPERKAEIAEAITVGAISEAEKILKAAEEAATATKQFKKLSPWEIKKLEDAGHDIHELKGQKGAAQRDLFKDKDGNIYVKPKDGSGPGEPTNININNP